LLIWNPGVNTVYFDVTGTSLTTILVPLALVPSQVPKKSAFIDRRRIKAHAPDQGPRATPHTSLPHDARTFSPSTTRTLREWHCFSLTRTRIDQEVARKGGQSEKPMEHVEMLIGLV